MNRFNEALDRDKIQDGICTSVVGRRVIVFKSTSSTNDIAWQYSANITNNGLAIFAESQEAGRGRQGNKWYAGQGESLLFSVLLIDCDVSAQMITLGCAVAVAQTLKDLSIKGVQVKWPNDILIDSKKIAGILVESRNSSIVIGIGVNCHQQREDFPDVIANLATSVDIEAGSKLDRVELAKKILQSLDKWIKTAKENEQKVLDAWQMFSSLLGKRIGVKYNNKVFHGHCIGVDPQEGLILQLDRGGVRMFQAGQSSIIPE